jgi:hypothetical protein
VDEWVTKCPVARRSSRTRYRTEFAMLEIPVVVRRVVIPIVYGLGRIFGKDKKFSHAPAPIR